MENWLEQIKEHFSYCIDEGLTIGKQEERLLERLYQRIERLDKENELVYGMLNQISDIIENGKYETRKLRD